MHHEAIQKAAQEAAAQPFKRTPDGWEIGAFSITKELRPVGITKRQVEYWVVWATVHELGDRDNPPSADVVEVAECGHEDLALARAMMEHVGQCLQDALQREADAAYAAEVLNERNQF